MGEQRHALGMPFPTGLAALAVSAVLIGRGLAVALPGAFAGIGAQIGWVELLAAYLTQLSALSFGVVSARMMFQALLGGTQPLFKGLAVVAVLATVSVVYVSSGTTYRLAHVWLLGMGLSVVGLAMGAGIRALARAERRGAGLVLIVATVAGAAHLGARWLALSAGDDGPRSYVLGQVFATVGLVAEALATGAAFLWLLSASQNSDTTGRLHSVWLFRFNRSVLVRAGAIVGGILAVGLGLASAGETEWRLLLSRVLGALATHPDPLVPRLAQNLLELLSFLACGLCLIPSSRAAQQRAVVALALLARASLDLPLGGLFLACAALALLVTDPPQVAQPTST